MSRERSEHVCITAELDRPDGGGCGRIDGRGTLRWWLGACCTNCDNSSSLRHLPANQRAWGSRSCGSPGASGIADQRLVGGRIDALHRATSPSQASSESGEVPMPEQIEALIRLNPPDRLTGASR